MAVVCLTDEDAGNPHPSRELRAQLRDDLSLDKERSHKNSALEPDFTSP